MNARKNAARVAVQAEPCLNTAHSLTKAQRSMIDDASTQLAVGSEVCIWLSALFTVIEDEYSKESPRGYLCRDLAGLGKFLADERVDRFDSTHRDIESFYAPSNGSAA